jgi:hypothetical protein
LYLGYLHLLYDGKIHIRNLSQTCFDEGNNIIYTWEFIYIVEVLLLGWTDSGGRVFVDSSIVFEIQ